MPSNDQPPPPAAQAGAADTINERSNVMDSDLQAEVDRLRAENEQLRGELEMAKRQFPVNDFGSGTLADNDPTTGAVYDGEGHGVREAPGRYLP
jgi:hypothetical protein